jgi:IS5 family transposase
MLPMNMAERVDGVEPITLAADKGYDTKDFVKEMRHMNVTPHVSQNAKRQGGSAIDGRTTRHEGYQVSQRKRKRIEEVFGWVKTVGMLRKTRHRELETVAWVFTLTATAYNLVRMRNLTVPAIQSEVRGELCFEFSETCVCGLYPTTWAHPKR